MTTQPIDTPSETELSTPSPQQPSIQSAAQQQIRDRLTTWSAALEMELQGLITKASITKQEMASAKTGTKQRYLDKKFKKITAEVMQMVTTMERLQLQRESVERDFGSSNA